VSKKTGDYQIPYDKDSGCAAAEAGVWHLYRDKIEWRDNDEWEDDMEVSNYIGTWKSLKTGKKYRAFDTEVLEMVKDAVKGKVSGRFRFIKRSTDYGLKYLGKCN